MTTPISKLRKHALPQREDTRDLDQHTPAAPREKLRPLHRREIDRHIESLTLEVAASLLTDLRVSCDGRAPRPRWVATRDFVEQMRRFLVYN